jgi:hypothetical protein
VSAFTLDVMSGSPLRPEELDDYGTDVATDDDPPERPGVSPAAEPRPWLVLGLVLLVVFLAILAYSVAWPALS